MEHQELIANLLNREESDDLDYKSAMYNLDTKRKKSEFIKDIVAMANTPRNSPAYILIGVAEQSGKVTNVTGVTDHPDEELLGSIVSGRVTPTPQFTYRQVAFNNFTLGLIEIPCTMVRTHFEA